MKLVFETKGLEEAVSKIKKYPELQPYIIRSSLNEAGRAGWTAASKKIRTVWNVKAGYRSKKVKGATGLKDVVHPKRATLTNLEYQLRVEGQTIPLLFFDAKDLKASRGGVSYKLKKKGGRGRVRSAFIAKSTKGFHAGTRYVLTRKTKDRYPLRPLTAISVPSMMKDTGACKTYIRATLKAFKKNYIRNAKLYFRRHQLKLRNR